MGGVGGVKMVGVVGRTEVPFPVVRRDMDMSGRMHRGQETMHLVQETYFISELTTVPRSVGGSAGCGSIMLAASYWVVSISGCRIVDGGTVVRWDDDGWKRGGDRGEAPYKLMAGVCCDGGQQSLCLLVPGC